jgi:hypothetical protein
MRYAGIRKVLSCFFFGLWIWYVPVRLGLADRRVSSTSISGWRASLFLTFVASDQVRIKLFNELARWRFNAWFSAYASPSTLGVLD